MEGIGGIYWLYIIIYHNSKYFIFWIGPLQTEYTSQDFNSVSSNGLLDFNSMNNSINNTMSILDPVFVHLILIIIDSAETIIQQ